MAANFTKKNDIKQYELAYYETLLANWKTKRQQLIEEFERVQAALNLSDFDHPNWHNVWFNNRPKIPAVDIMNAILFMTRAESYILLRKQQCEMASENCKDAIKWATLSQKTQNAFEEVQAASAKDAQILVDCLSTLTFMQTTRGEFSRFEVKLFPLIPFNHVENLIIVLTSYYYDRISVLKCIEHLFQLFIGERYHQSIDADWYPARARVSFVSMFSVIIINLG